MASRLWSCLVLVLSLVASGPVTAQDLRMALSAEPTTLDPLSWPVSWDEQIARHLFDPLILQDAHQRLTPGLAVSWSAVDDTTWEFRLRRGVRFSDGTEFTAEDVAAAFRHALNLPAGRYGIYTRQVTGIEVVDPYTIRLRSKAPYPQMPYDVSVVSIISRKAEAATMEDFDRGPATIGTGPFRLVEWVKGERLVMERNEMYWGPRPAWKRISVMFIPNDAARIAALRSSEADVIDFVPASALSDLRGRADASLVESPSSTVTYLHSDSYRDRTPFATDKAGAPLDRNPFRDRRVRQAISKAIDRRVIVDRVREGLAVEAAQLVPDEYFGASHALAPEVYDPEGAKRLLAEAGYPNGFGTTLHASSDRLANAQLATTLAQMLSRVGIDARVEALPESIYKARGVKYEFSFFLANWTSDTAEASGPLRGIVTTPGFQGWGQTNRGRYSNPELDGLLGLAMKTLDDRAREGLLQRAMEIAIGDAAVVPICFESSAWALRKGFAFKGRTDRFTLAQDVTPVP